MNATTARLVHLIARVLETEAWQGAGIRSASHWVAWKCGVSPARAKRLVLMARRLAELPETRNAFDEGALCEDQFAVICRHAPPSFDADAAVLAKSATVVQLQRVLGSYPENLVALCHRHHRLHHLGKVGIEGNADVPDGIHFTDERGRTLDATGRPILPGTPFAGGPDVWEIVAALRHVTGREAKRVAALAEQFGLHERQVVIALNYAAAHRDEIEARVRANDRALAEAERIAADGERLLA